MKFTEKRKTEKKNSTPETDRRYRAPMLIVIAAAFLLLAVGTVFLINTINSSVYSERKEYLGEITTATAKTVNESINNQKKQAGIISNVVKNELPEAGNLNSFVTEFAEQLGLEKDIFFLVDNGGNYYSSDGHEGRLVDRTYYTDKTEDELEYLSTLPHMSSDKTYLIYRFRFDEPVTAGSQGNKTEIKYFAIMHDLDELNNTISSLFEGSNNTFIYEKETGTMLYKKFGIGLLIDGYVLYPKFRAAKFVNGEDSDELINACRNDETVVAEMEVNGFGYYFCSAPLEVGDWSLAMILQKDYITETTGSAFNGVINSILAFAGLLCLAIVAVVGMTIKIRSSRREQEVLAKANAAKTAFLFNMSHDIRTPMNAVIGFTDIAMKHIDDREKVEESLRKTKYSGNLLLALINDILEFSRIESGTVRLQENGGNLVTLFEDIHTVLADMADEKNINLTFEKGEIRDSYVNVDESCYQRLLINIISNGIKYTPEGGWVKARMEQLDNDEGGRGVYRFTVQDNGIGMSEEFQEHLFEEFSREQNSTTSGIQGTGLGLALCKAIADIMGGTIECESVQGEGSTFTITLPLQIADAEDAVELETEPAEVSLEGCRVLLVEDNELNREIAGEILGDAGVTVDEAEDGAVALEMLKEKGIEIYDFILMDIQMPVMNGYETSREICRLYPDSPVPVIALSANAFEEDRQKSMEAGMVDHIAKPININELYGVLGRHRRRGGAQ